MIYKVAYQKYRGPGSWFHGLMESLRVNRLTQQSMVDQPRLIVARPTLRRTPRMQAPAVLAPVTEAPAAMSVDTTLSGSISSDEDAVMVGDDGFLAAELQGMTFSYSPTTPTTPTNQQ